MPFQEKLPDWHAEGVEPPESKRNTGWEPGERPPAEYWNWQMNRTYKALEELQKKAIHKDDVKASDIPIEDAAGHFTADNVEGALNELFTSVSDGKAQIAAAITDKGVPTSPTDSFATMAANIEAIPVGPDTSDATATPADILSGKTAYGAEGTKMTGTMPNRTGHVTGQSISRNGTTLRIRPQAGYYPGDAANSVQFSDPNWIAANIRQGVSIFGLTGTLTPMLAAYGTTLSNSSAVTTVSGLAFRPSYVIAIMKVNTAGATSALRIYYPHATDFNQLIMILSPTSIQIAPPITINNDGFSITWPDSGYSNKTTYWFACAEIAG